MSSATLTVAGPNLATASPAASFASRIPDAAPPLILEDLLMSDAVKVGFVPFSTAVRGILVVFCDDALKFGPATSKALASSAGTIKRAAAASQFKGKAAAALDILVPEGLKADRLIVIGTGKPSSLKDSDFLKFGGVLGGTCGRPRGRDPRPAHRGRRPGREPRGRPGA